MAPFTRHAIDTFISEKIGAITTCGATNPGEEFKASGMWVSAFGLTVIFQDSPPTEQRALALQFLRRVEVAFAEYGRACDLLKKLIEGGVTHWSVYFRALYHFEATIGQLYGAYDGARTALDKEYFRRNDESVLDRLNKVHNVSKHSVAVTDQPTWLTNTGVCCAVAEISFGEIECLLRSYGLTANIITNQSEPS